MIADADPELLRDLTHVLHQLLAALFGQLRNRDADELSIAHRVEAQVGGLYRLLDIMERRLVVGSDYQQPHLGRGQPSQLAERGLGPVVIDRQVLDECGGGAPGAHPRKLMLESLDGFFHFLASHLNDFAGHDATLSTRVPMVSPITALLILPGLRKLKTMMGSWLSMHIEMAVESITFRFFCKTSM